MNFADSIKLCFAKYADFNGRAKRPEYWWFALFIFLVSLTLEMVLPMVAIVFTLATLLPSIAVAARRLHDTNRSGWWQLLVFIPILGWIVLLVFLAQEGDPLDNQFGGVPTN